MAVVEMSGYGCQFKIPIDKDIIEIRKMAMAISSVIPREGLVGLHPAGELQTAIYLSKKQARECGIALRRAGYKIVRECDRVLFPAEQVTEDFMKKRIKETELVLGESISVVEKYCQLEQERDALAAERNELNRKVGTLNAKLEEAETRYRNLARNESDRNVMYTRKERAFIDEINRLEHKISDLEKELDIAKRGYLEP